MTPLTYASMVGNVIDVPGELVAAQERFNGAAGRAFVADLPRRTAEFLRRWRLRIDGPSMYGMCALVLPVVRADGSPAVLKLQFLDEESEGEPVALRVWDGEGAVRLLEQDPATGSLLLERLDPARALTHVPDSRAAVLVLARLLARLTSVRAPEGMRQLGDSARAMLEAAPRVLPAIPDPRDRRLMADCVAAVREVAAEPGDRLLHWDLHYDNVLAADREPWLAIDPKPLSGDPGFELFPALRNRFEPDETVWRFDAMTEVLGLDRERARAWTLGRVLQYALWEAGSGHPPSPDELEIGRALRR
ncbi:aminoglycoside phosphotransferase family protein [Streptomyces sp. NPDC003631]|uniref:aminoglycoside phosphotransferase family protein n=1 Tax=unclassified Streptomyces TaxID=2593676 RepID=UPI003643A678